MSSGWIDMVAVIARHNVHANEILFREASRLDRQILEGTSSPSRESIYQLLVHLLAVEMNYLSQITGGDRVLSDEDRSSMLTLSAGAEVHRARLLTFVSSLTDAELMRETPFRFSTGATLRYTVWQILTQIFLHSAQHRGELSILLSELGHPLPIDDIIVRFSDESGQAWPFR